MSKKHDFRDRNTVRQDYRRRTSLFPKPVNLHGAGQFHMVDYEFHAPVYILRTIARARNDDQIASELNQPPSQSFVFGASLGHSPIPPVTRSKLALKPRCLVRGLLPGRETDL